MQSEITQHAGRCSTEASPLPEVFCSGWPPSISLSTPVTRRCLYDVQQHVESIHIPRSGMPKSAGLANTLAARPHDPPHWSARILLWISLKVNRWLALHRSAGLLSPKESLIARFQWDCSGELDLSGSSPVWGVMGRNYLWRHLCGSCRGGKG